MAKGGRTFNDPAAAAAYAARLQRELDAQQANVSSPPQRDQSSFRAAQWDADIAAQEERAERLEQTVFVDTKEPTETEFPHRPRSRRAEYDPATQILRIWWDRPGKLGPYTNYYDVTPQEWDQVQNVISSTGKYVNRVLNYKYYDYE